jgi:UDP-N-acetylmuramoylalanine--D-glutamate ligase
MTALLVGAHRPPRGVAGNIGPTMLQTLAEALEREPEAPVEGMPGPEAPTDPQAAAAAAAAVTAYSLPAHAAFDALDAPVEVLAEEVLPADEEAADPPATDLADMQASNESSMEPAPMQVPSPSRLSSRRRFRSLVLVPPPPAEPVFEHLPEVWVLELSSFQLDKRDRFEPSAATVLNITQDHLDWHGTMDAYARAKARIFGKDAVMIINRDDPIVEALVPAPVQLKETPGRSQVSLTRSGGLTQGGRSGGAHKGRNARPIERRVMRFGLGAPSDRATSASSPRTA